MDHVLGLHNTVCDPRDMVEQLNLGQPLVACVFGANLLGCIAKHYQRASLLA